jgi:AsmA protein
MRQIDPFQQSAPLSPQPGTTVEHESAPQWNEEPPPGDGGQWLSSFTQHLRRFRFVYLGVLVLLLLVFVPPLVNLSRYQRKVATSIGNSLGRPVHLNRVSMTLLPLPGFSIEDLVVGEDPAFGAEPIIRANSVRATLRISSLWRRHVEFSSISFTDPSVNLVHAANGKWNIEGILLQASRIETAPTAQRSAGSAPRFPYIEATGARLNIKEGQEKLPFSLTDADFALWLPDPHQWHLRLRAHPDRTDANVSDTGTIEFESTLGAASSLSQVPFNLEGQWRDAQMGEASRILFGHDAGWRGQMNFSVHARGTFGENAVTARLRLLNARPADFVPDQPISTEAECFATATGLFHAFEDLRCNWPPTGAARTPTVTLTGSIPNVHNFRESTLKVTALEVPASRLVTWLRAISTHVPEDLTAAGTLTGTLNYEASRKSDSAAQQQSAGRWLGQFTVAEATLKLAEGSSFVTRDSDSTTLLTGDVHLFSAGQEIAPRRRGAQPAPAARGFVLAPTPLLLGGHDPATLEGQFDLAGYTLHLTGQATSARLQTLARALPPVGDGLLKALPENHPSSGPFRIDLTATHPWWGQQTWTENLIEEQERPVAPRRTHHGAGR